MMAEEMCQGKQSCSIDTGFNILSPGSLDPCPGVRYRYGVQYSLSRISRPLSWSQVQIQDSIFSLQDLQTLVQESGIDTGLNILSPGSLDPCPVVRYRYRVQYSLSRISRPLSRSQVQIQGSMFSLQDLQTLVLESGIDTGFNILSPGYLVPCLRVKLNRSLETNLF